MALNIKNKETCDLAREVAEMTDDTMTGAITVALRKRLEQVKQEHANINLADELLAIGKRCAAEMGPGPTSTEIRR